MSDDIEADSSAEEPSDESSGFKSVTSRMEADARKRWGPPELRRKKNQAYSDRLVRRYSEPVIRGLLTALRDVQGLVCTRSLARLDLAKTPLAEIIEPFQILGLDFKILGVEDHLYRVSIGSGWETVGDGGEFLIERHGDLYSVKESGIQWIA